MEDVGDHQSTFRINSYISSKGNPRWPLALILSIRPPISTTCCLKPPDLMRQMLQGFINEDPVHPSSPDLRC